jgi:hypothetical protein
MLWIYYQNIAYNIKEEILKEYKTLKGKVSCCSTKTIQDWFGRYTSVFIY